MMFKVLGFAAMAVAASATSDPWACGEEGEACCNQRDCTGSKLECDHKDSDDSVCKAVEDATECGECCGDEDCPAGLWCVHGNVCEVKCGMEGAECCNGSDCIGNDLVCDHVDGDDICVEKTATSCGGECCGDVDCPKGEWCTEDFECGPMCGMEGAECCNGSDCSDSKLVCDEDEDECVACGSDWEPPCPGNVCRGFLEPVHEDGMDKCMVCGKEDETACPFGKCRDGLTVKHIDGEDICISCGGDGEIPCSEGGCEDGLMAMHMAGGDICRPGTGGD